MSVDRYASLELSTGSTVVKKGDIWWHQVRPFLYRPLLPFRKYDLGNAVRQFGKFGAYQHGVIDGQPHNSYLNFIVFEDLHNYATGQLHKGVRRNLEATIKNDVALRRVLDEEEFSAKAYDVYLSFYRRTKYSFDTSRATKDGFAQWTRALFEFQDLVIVGAFSGQELLAFEIACLVEDAVILKTVAHSDKGIEFRTPDLLLHYWRVSTRETQSINVIYDSMLLNTLGINEFKIRRGARVTALPAFLHINPVVLWLIRTASKSIHTRLLGREAAEALTTGRTSQAA